MAPANEQAPRTGIRGAAQLDSITSQSTSRVSRTAHSGPQDDADCPDAMQCPHEPRPPLEGYWKARGRLVVVSVAQAFPGWPRHHLNAIWRARRQRGRAA